MPMKSGGHWSIADEYADVQSEPRDTASSGSRPITTSSSARATPHMARMSSVGLASIRQFIRDRNDSAGRIRLVQHVIPKSQFRHLAQQREKSMEDKGHHVAPLASARPRPSPTASSRVVTSRRPSPGRYQKAPASRALQSRF